MLYSDAIKAVRTGRKMTQADFGESLGVTGQAVFYWESGEVLPSDKQKKALHDQYDIPFEVFFDGL